MINFFIFLALLSLSAMFAAAETALFSLRDSRVLLMERRHERNAHLIARLKRDPQRLLVTILVGNTIVNLSIASFAAVLGIQYFGSIGAGVAAGITTIVILLWGEIFPKSFAFNAKEKTARWLAPPVMLCFLVLYPVSAMFVVLDRAIKRRFSFHTPNPVSEEEIRIMAELGLAEGEIDHHEHEMIERIFQFDDIPVLDVMTPAKNIVALDGEVSVDHLAHFVAHTAYSRYPVYVGNPNDFIGYIHTNDVMRVLNSDQRDKPIGDFVLPLRRIEARINLREAFRQMTKERSHLYLVYDAKHKDKVIGLVTLEDILESIVGEIEDEGDGRSTP